MENIANIIMTFNKVVPLVLIIARYVTCQTTGGKLLWEGSLWIATIPFQLPTLMEVGVIGVTGDHAQCLSLVSGEEWEPGAESVTTLHPRSGESIINRTDGKVLFFSGSWGRLWWRWHRRRGLHRRRPGNLRIWISSRLEARVQCDQGNELIIWKMTIT